MKKLYTWTLIYNFCQFIYWTVKHLTSTKLGEALHGEAFRRLLVSYLKMNPKVDFLGRVYGVVNPSVNSDGKFDWGSVIFEIDGINSNNYSYVENWIYKQLMSVEAVFGLDNSKFFDLITMDVSHVGPANADNYLIVFDTVPRRMMAKSFKRTFIQGLIYCIIGFSIYMII